MNNKQDLIVLEQLPIIKTYLEKLSLEIKEKVDKATSLVCTPDNYKEIKEVRATLTKEFNELETQRKQVKNAIMEKYNDFEKIYKENVANIYQEADRDLKKKIDESIYILVKEKEDKIKQFAEEHIKFNHLETIIEFKDIPLNINLSCSMKSLENDVLAFIKMVSDDMECISSDEYRDEILYEYQHNGFKYTNAVMTVRKKQEEIQKIKQQQEKIEEVKQEEIKVAEVVEEVVELAMPKEVEPIDTWQFTIKATKTQAKEIKEFIKSKGVEIL